MKLRWREWGRGIMLFAALSFVCLTACGHSSSPGNSAQGTGSSQAATFPPAPAPETTGGFDGARAYKHIKFVEPGDDYPAAVAMVMAQPEVAYLHVRSATAQCFTFEVRRA